MRTIKQIYEAFGYTRSYNPPPLEYKYYAYINGKAHTCASEETARTISKNIEKVFTQKSKEARDNYHALQNKQTEHVQAVWEAELQQEFDHLNKEIFDVCYEEAYDRYHSSGFDEVADGMSGIVDFAQRIMKASAS